MEKRETPAGVTITETGSSTNISESGTTDTYSLVLTDQPTADVTISVSTNAQVTVSLASVVFTMANWNMAQFITVSAVDDFVAEGPHFGTITHMVSSVDSSYNGLAVAGVAPGITDNDTAGVTVTQSGGTTVTEGGASDTYTLVLTSQPTASVTVAVSPDSQVTLSVSSLIFTTANWNTMQVVSVVPVDDVLVEATHSGIITHTATSGDSAYSGITVASVTASITDNDTAGVTNSKVNVSVTEGGATDSYTVVLAAQPASNVVVTLNQGTMVTLSQTLLTFTSSGWNTAQTVSVTAVNDSVAQGAHTGTITATSSSSHAAFNGLTIASVTANITDNDVAGVTNSKVTVNVTEGGATDSYTIVLTSQPTSNVSIVLGPSTQVTLSQTAFSFTTSNWNTAQTVTVTAANDNVAQGGRTVTISATASSGDANYAGAGVAIAQVSAVISDNDVAGISYSKTAVNVTEGATTDSFTAVLTSQPTASVVLTLNAGTQATVSPSVLTFTTINWNVARSVTVTAVNDVQAEGSPHLGTISGTVTSTDVTYSGIASAGITVSITDNDIAGSTLAQTGGTTIAVEGGTSDIFTLVLNTQPAPSNNVLITLNPGPQLGVSPTVLTFNSTNWNATQAATVTANNDLVVEGNHTGIISFTVTSTDTFYNALAVASLTTSITDNDVAGLTYSKTTVNVTEGGATDSYTLALSGQPSATVRVTLNPGTEMSLTQTVFTFTTLNWNVAQSVTVSAIDDVVPEVAATIPITATASSADVNFNGILLASVSASVISDDPFPGATVVQSGGDTAVTEGGALDAITVALTTIPANNVIITVIPDAQCGALPTRLTFMPGSWNTPQLVNVTATDDTAAEGYHTGIIAFAATSADVNYNGIAIASITATVTDNDLAVFGTVNADYILINSSGGVTQVFVNSKATVVPAGTQRIVLDAGAGNDVININAPGLPVDIFGNTGTDRVFLTGATTANTFNLDSTTVDINGDVVSFTQVENLVLNGNRDVDSFTVLTLPTFPTEIKGDVANDILRGPDITNTWSFSATKAGLLNGSLKFSNIESLVGGLGDDNFIFAARKSFGGMIDGGAGGTDVLDYVLYGSAVTVNLQTATATGLSTFANIAAIKVGTSLQDKLTAANIANTWTLTSANSGQVSAPSNVAAAGLLDFSGFESLFGGSDDDSFAFEEAVGVAGRIQGGAGANTFDFTNYATTSLAVNLLTNKVIGKNPAGLTLVSFPISGIQSFIGGSGGNQLTSANIAHTWTLTGINTGTLVPTTAVATTISFAAFENLVGGTGVDKFHADAGWTGLISGGAGSDELYADSNDHAWALTAKDAGTLDSQNFAAIETLVGGIGNDTFTMTPGASLSGKIIGGTGTDVLDYSAYINMVTINLATNQATATAGISQIASFIAGAHSGDLLTGPILANSWNFTNLGTGTINAASTSPLDFTGFENLSGGALADTFTLSAMGGWSGLLNGSSGSDTLIAFGLSNVYTGSSTGLLNGQKFTNIEVRS